MNVANCNDQLICCLKYFAFLAKRHHRIFNAPCTLPPSWGYQLMGNDQLQVFSND
jgi:hypothetical protein